MSKVTITREQADVLLIELVKRTSKLDFVLAEHIRPYVQTRDGWDLALLLRDVVLQWDKECAAVRAKNRKHKRAWY